MVNKYLILTITVYPEEEHLVAVCEELGISSFGANEHEALDNIIEAAELYLHTLEDLGERDYFLNQKGVTIHEQSASVVGDRIRCPPGAIVRPAILTLSGNVA